MKVSLQIANKYSNVDLLAINGQELLQRIGAQLGAVEDVQDWATRYKGIYVVKVLEVANHPNADKLHVCLIDDGGAVKDVQRTEEGYIKIVCGAPEVEAGMTLAWISPGAVVPSTIDKDPLTLDVREIRGIPSPGMLGTPRELGISDDHSQLLVIDPVQEQLAVPGTPFVKLYGLEDLIIDCENKMFTHRPDCFGILGVARELAGISGQAFVSPKWYQTKLPVPAPTKSLPLNVFNFVPDLTPRFMALIISDITIKPSPYWLQAALTKVGIRPINNIVDITNYMMQLTAQPMHAFDYDKIKLHSQDQGSPNIGVRMALPGEKLTVLSGKQLTLTDKDLVVATDKVAADLAGVMGGGHTEIDQDTKTIVLTCATFDMYSVRRSTMRHGLFSDAATRYTKGQSMLQNDRVLAYATQMISELANGVTASEVFDDPGDIHPLKNVNLEIDFINERLGVTLDANQIATLLTNVEFLVDVTDNNLSITAPFWRTDIELPEDVVEEVGRLYGYDKLPVQLPVRSSAPVAKNPRLEQSRRLRELLAKCGANEVLTYSFVSEQLLDAAGQNSKEAYQLSNALSPELQYYRLTLTPSLLSKVTQNLRAGYDKFAIFEIGKTHLKLQGVNEEGLPQENPMLSLVVSTNDKLAKAEDGAAYYQAKQYLEKVATFSGLDLDYEPLTDEVHYEIVKPFQPGRAALITDKTSGNYLGVIGEFKPGLRKKLKLPEHTAGLEIMLEPLLGLKATNPYAPLSKYPAISQDVTFTGPETLEFGNLKTTLDAAIQSSATTCGYKVTCQPLGIYHKPKTKNKNISFRLSISNPVQTLTTDQASSFVDEVVTAVTKELKIKRT